MQQDYYQILGVSRDATVTEIKKAYKKLVFKYHPDRNRDNLEEAEAVMKEVNIAYEVLSDENKRAEYDRNFNSTSSNYSSSNSGDLSFKIGSRTINYNRDMKLFTAIKRSFDKTAMATGSAYQKVYLGLENLDNFHEKGYNLGAVLILASLNEAVKMCAEVDRYDINVDRFLELDVDNIISKPWTEAFMAVDEQYIEIQSTVLSEEERRELRKNSRAKMVGAGFGLKNAVIASMEAGAVNLATGAIHSIFNSIGNAFTRASANNKKKAIYNNEKIFMILKDGLEASIRGISIVLAYKVFNLYPFEKDIHSALAIVDNLKANRIPKNRVVNAILDALEIYPFEHSLYDKGKQYLHGTDLKVLNDMAEFFGINEQRKSCIEQYLSFAETYKENNNMESALKWYERAANLNSLKALRFLGKHYLEEESERAINYLKKAADLGDIESIYELGNYYYYEDENKEAVYYFEQVIRRAGKNTEYYNEAAECLGECYFYGYDGVKQDYERAYELLLPLTTGKSKSSSAQFMVAECYFNGWGIKKDINKAIELYTEAAQDDDEDAQLFLAKYYCEGTHKDYAKAIPLLKNLVEEDNDTAKMYLAKCYFNGYGVEKDCEEAVDLLEDIADLDDIREDKELAYNLARCYYEGIGTDTNYEDAVYLLESAAKQGDNKAQYYLGMSYYKLNNMKESIYWLSKSASTNNSFAQYQMALFYFDGNGVERDYTKAFDIFSRLIHQNHKGIAYYLGQCYLKGLGTEKNYVEAVRLLKIADNEGNVQAAYDLGCCYYDGHGVNQNYVEAIKYFTKSAKANDKNSWYMLAVCYEKGIGVKQSAENAFKFYYKAANLGHNDAVFAVGRCYENAIGTEKNIIEAIKYYETAGKAGNNLALKQLKLLTEQKSVQKEVNKYNKAVEKEIKAEEKAAKREEQKNSIKEGCSTGCGCLIWIIILYFIYKWLFD